MTARCFTSRYLGRSSVLINDVAVFAPFDDPKSAPNPTGVPFKALWDTGATNTVITQKVVDALGLKSVGFAQSHHAQGTAVTEKYFVSLGLPNGVGFTMLEVTRGDLPGFDLLIGMDVIGSGDFAVTNFNGNTVFSFRQPSCEEIDFVKKPQPPAKSTKVPRNSLCSCGSGKKYKNCCGRS
ncbi:MAG: retroviral-like aspartic protease family protein [Thermoanaerobaculaceae bacterium]|jgi:hypothetical protein